MKAKTMDYDSYNRIVRVTNSDTNKVAGEYWYDDQGFRVRRNRYAYTKGTPIAYKDPTGHSVLVFNSSSFALFSFYTIFIN